MQFQYVMGDMRGDRAIRALAEGDSNALSVLYDLYGRLILSVAYTIVENSADAEDVLQDTMIELMRYAASYKAGSNPRAFVLSIARHRAIDLVRKRKPQVPLEDAGDRSSDDGALEAVEVLELLRGLSEEERSVVILHLYAGLPHRQVAEMLGMSVALAQKKYQRALQKLRGYYEQ